MIPLYKPYMPHLPQLDDILHSGQLSYGIWGRKFENKLRSYIGQNNLMTTNTYSMSINIALTVLDLQPGDEVIASPMSCLASTQPLNAYGLKIKWGDIDPQTGTLNPDSVLSIITSKTKLIFHNHYCGYIGYVDEINAIAREYGIAVIDDCIEAFGSEYKGKTAGNLGTDITVFSFQTVRIPNTIDGGAVVFNDKKLYNKALLVRDQGINRSIFRDKYGEISTTCDISMKGYAGTMSEINSYIGCMQMADIDKLLVKQQDNALKWHAKLGADFTYLDSRKEIKPNYWVFGLLTEKKVADMLYFRQQGFYASGVHLPNTYYSVFGKRINLPGVEEFNRKFLAIPCGWWK